MAYEDFLREQFLASNPSPGAGYNLLTETTGSPDDPIYSFRWSQAATPEADYNAGLLSAWNSTDGSVQDKLQAALDYANMKIPGGKGVMETSQWAIQNGLASPEQIQSTGQWTQLQQTMASRDKFGGFWELGKSFGDPFSHFADKNNVSPVTAIAGLMGGAALAGGGAAGAAGVGAEAAGAGATGVEAAAAAAGGASPVLGAAPVTGLASGGAALTPAAAATGAVAGGMTLANGSSGASAATTGAQVAEGGGSDGGAAGGGSSGGTGLAPTAANTALGRIMDGTATQADWLSILGTAGATGLGLYGSGQQADALRDIANQARADRQPFLSASLGYLNNPQSYAEGPGKAMLDANLRALSAKHGNPIDSPTALGIATQAGLSDWRNSVLGFGNLGLAGQDSRMQMQANAAGADANGLNALGWGLGQVTNPPTSIEQLMRQMSQRNSMGLA